MIDYNKSRFLPLIISCALIVSCANRKTLIEQDWVSVRPNDPNYYHGIGQVSKTGERQKYIAECRNMAMSEIAEQIEVHVKVESKSKIKELEKRFPDEDFYYLEKSFESISAIRSEMTLTGVEAVGEWEDNSFYYVYKRLSKAVYEKMVQNKIKDAVNIASEYYVQAYRYMNKDPTRAISNLFSAYRQLFPFQDRILLADDPLNPEDKFYVDIVVRMKLNDMLQSITFTSNSISPDVKLGKAVSEPLSVKLSYTNEIGQDILLKNAPLRFYFEYGNGDLVEKTKTNSSGEAYTKVTKVKSKDPHQIVRVELDLESFVGKDKIGKIITTEYKNINMPYGRFELNVKTPVIFLDGRELSLGNPTSNPVVLPAIIKSLEERIGATFTENGKEADYVLEYEVNTERLGELYGQFSVIAHMNIFLKEGNNTISAHNIQNIKGIHLSYEKASSTALKKLAEKVENEIGKKIAKHFLE